MHSFEQLINSDDFQTEGGIRISFAKIEIGDNDNNGTCKKCVEFGDLRVRLRFAILIRAVVAGGEDNVVEHAAPH